MFNKSFLLLSMLWMTIVLAACGLSGDVSEKEQVQIHKIVLDSQTTLTFALPSDLILELGGSIYRPEDRMYVAKHPDNTEKRYLGGMKLMIEEDLDGYSFERFLELNRLSAETPNFKLLQQDTIQRKDFTIHWFQFETSPDPYNINLPNIQNNIIIYESPWYITLICHYPIGDQDSSLPLVAELFIETVKITNDNR